MSCLARLGWAAVDMAVLYWILRDLNRLFRLRYGRRGKLDLLVNVDGEGNRNIYIYIYLMASRIEQASRLCHRRQRRRRPRQVTSALDPSDISNNS